jgi:hypothetical protein
MFVSTPVYYFAGPPNSHSELSRHVRGPDGPSKRSYFSNLIVGELRPTTGRASALAPGVQHVVSVRSKKQMGRIAAGRVVAAMEHKQSSHLLIIAQLKCYPVRVVAAEKSVAFFATRCCP